MIDGDALPTLAGTRLRLRWLTPGDVDALFEVFGDPEVVRYWSSPALETPEDAQELLESIHQYFAEKTLFQWGIALAADDRVIGTCTLAEVDAGNLRAELGFALGSAWWQQGYVTEALGVLLRFAFDELGLRRLEADIDTRNEASIRTVEKLGFRREGLMRERWLVNGELQDTAFYGLLAREWRERAGE